MQTRFDAIVLGAGPAGSTAAILLARAGWSVALIEKQRFPRRKVCGECIAASNLPLLDALGVGAAFAQQAGAELRRVAVLQGARTVIADLPAAALPGHAYARALGREVLDPLLLAQAQAAGAVVLQPWCVQALAGGPGAHRCAVRSVESGRVIDLEAAVLIAAHGSWESLPAERPQRRQRRQSGDLIGFKANFRGATLAPDVLPVLSFAGGYGGMVVADDGLLTLACCIRADTLDACRRAAPGLRAGEAVQALLMRECRGVAEALAGARLEGPWLAAGPLDPGIRLRADEPFFRIGNAAGEAHPIIGEGMSMAMQSAWLLCDRLLQPAGPAGRLTDPAWQRAVATAYAAEWRQHFAPRLRLAASFANMAMRPALFAPVLTVLARWPGLLTRAARWSGKLTSAPPPATVARLAAGNGRPRRLRTANPTKIT